MFAGLASPSHLIIVLAVILLLFGAKRMPELAKGGHQGRGLGRELMAFAEERARRDGLPEIRLYTNEKMHENLAVYAKQGFEGTGRRLDGGYRRVFMRKRLH